MSASSPRCANPRAPSPSQNCAALCRVRKATLYERLTALTGTGRLVRGTDGYRLAGTD